ncbi:hypothetical protein [Lysobacter antibioticus]|uniref:hypothetical protein n=1 Tax=Lysobacter antibioticus TaxID=84531 RepID=UPI0011873416|nr:hypothetical protein [Lysobacter antibioticus]
MLFFKSPARTSDAYAVIFHTGHPCPDEKRRASLRAALRVFCCLRECESAHSTIKGNIKGNGNGDGSRSGLIARTKLFRPGRHTATRWIVEPV